MKVNRPGIFTKHTHFQRLYLKKYAGKINDDVVAHNCGLTKSQVEYYRRYSLGINHNPPKDAYMQFTVEGAKEELNALLKYHSSYTGCMIDSLEYRIKELSIKIAM